MRAVLLTILLLSVSSGVVRAEERISWYPDFITMIGHYGGTVEVSAADGEVDKYHFDLSGDYVVNVFGKCVSGQWWIDLENNTLHSTDPFIDSYGNIGYEWYKEGGRFYMQPNQDVQIGATRLTPVEVRAEILSFSRGDIGCY